MPGHTILLTSTIQPKAGQKHLKVLDVESRLQDYKQALVFYQSMLDKGVIDKVVFVDNSGYNLTSLKEVFTHPNIEWLSFYGLDYPSEYHRGYGEFKLIDYAFEHAQSLNCLAEDDKVWKVTGRYIIENLPNLLRYSPKSFDFYCNTRKNWVDMEVLAWSKAGYENIVRDLWQHFASGMAPELILSKYLPQKIAQNKIVDKFYWWPHIIGRRGTDGGQFSTKSSRYKFFIKQAIKATCLPFRQLIAL